MVAVFRISGINDTANADAHFQRGSSSHPPTSEACFQLHAVPPSTPPHRTCHRLTDTCISLCWLGLPLLQDYGRAEELAVKECHKEKGRPCFWGTLQAT